MKGMAKLQYEQAVYRVADAHYVGYQGGSWSLSRSGVWSPKVSGKVNLVCPDNYADVVVSAKAAGYGLSVVAASRLGWDAYNRGYEGNARYWFALMESVKQEALDKLRGDDVAGFLSYID